MIEEVAKLLKEKKLTISTAESCTGGLLAHMLTNVPGSSEYYKGGVVAYSNEAKICMLHVRRATIEKYGAVSEQTAYEMADGAKREFDTDFAISTTGVAGPTGSEKKPVGLVYIGFANPYGIEVREYKFEGDRLQNKQQFANAALKILLDFLIK